MATRDDLTEKDAMAMLEAITGDNPPPLESWTAQDWMNLQFQFEALRAMVKRLDGRMYDMSKRLLDYEKFEEDVKKAVEHWG